MWHVHKNKVKQFQTNFILTPLKMCLIFNGKKQQARGNSSNLCSIIAQILYGIKVAFQEDSELLTQGCNTAFLMEKNAHHATKPHHFPLHQGEAVQEIQQHKCQNRGKADQFYMKKLELFQFCFCSLLLNKVTLTIQFLTN